MRKTFIVLCMVVLMGLLLTACELPASQAPATAAVPKTGETAFPTGKVPTIQNMGTATVVALTPQATAKGPVVATQQPGQPVVGTPVAPVATKVPVIIPTLGRPDKYTVVQGDHAICIARRYNLDLSDFFAVNGLTFNSRLEPGDVLRLPAGGTWSLANGPRELLNHPDSYTVAANDTVNKIACLYGDLDPAAIIAVNGLKSPYTLTAGQVLQIP
jgi:LysM repeat protein